MCNSPCKRGVQVEGARRRAGDRPPIIIASLDRNAIARARRQAQALDALEFEQGRERALKEQIELLVVESDGASIDAAAFGRMDPTDVALVREILGDVWAEADGEDDDILESGFVDLEDEGDTDEDAGDGEDEIARLGREIETSRALQTALERYIAALDEAPG